ncbi:MAG TPA: hypothetical protein VLI04_07240 [Nocardioidaceae bacterium]|nr:hypothetical protein [Nocardioidaceae bacterium]
MNTSIEDRLTAALHARADQVQPEDLRPLEPVRPVRSWRPALVAAAVVLLMAMPVGALLLGREDGEVGPSEAPTSTTTQLAWVDHRLPLDRADLDGDGLDDQGVIVYETYGEAYGAVEVRVTLAGSGRTLSLATGVDIDLPPEGLSALTVSPELALFRGEAMRFRMHGREGYGDGSNEGFEERFETVAIGMQTGTRGLTWITLP